MPKKSDFYTVSCPTCPGTLKLKLPEGCSAYQLSEPARGDEVKAVTEVQCSGPLRHFVKVYWTKPVFITMRPD
jgi:hypothetical protein